MLLEIDQLYDKVAEQKTVGTRTVVMLNGITEYLEKHVNSPEDVSRFTGFLHEKAPALAKLINSTPQAAPVVVHAEQKPVTPSAPAKPATPVVPAKPVVPADKPK
jgi:hypothetical protein